MKRIILTILLLSLIIALLTGCGKPTLDEWLADSNNSLRILDDDNPTKTIEIKCSDYTLYSIHGGIDCAINATRYSFGLKETTDRFAEYPYIVKDNATGWKYIFENRNDIITWANQN